MIDIQDLKKAYKENKVFDNFNCLLDSNLTLVIGRNGIGKSTLLNCITDYIKYDGKIKISGIISYLPEFRGFDEDVASKDLLKLVNINKTDISRWKELLSFEREENKKIIQLSKGNQTKLFILCTLVKPADIYIFDEPTDGLDLHSRESFALLIKELSLEKQVVISSHDLGFIDRMKDAKECKLLNLDELNGKDN